MTRETRRRKWIRLHEGGVKQVEIKPSDRLYQGLTRNGWKILSPKYQNFPILPANELRGTEFEKAQIRTICKYCLSFTNHLSSCKYSNSHSTNHAVIPPPSTNSSILNWITQKTSDIPPVANADQPEEYSGKKKKIVTEEEISSEELEFYAQAELQYQQRKNASTMMMTTTTTTTTTTSTTQVTDTSSVSCEEVDKSENDEDVSDSDSLSSCPSNESGELITPFDEDGDEEDENAARKAKRKALVNAKNKLVEELRERVAEEPNPIVLQFIEDEEDTDVEIDLEEDEDEDEGEDQFTGNSFLSAFFETEVAPHIPEMKNHTPKTPGDYRHLLTRLIPNPHCLTGELRKFQHSGEAHAFAEARFQLIDPHLFPVEWIGEQGNHKLVCKKEHNGKICGNNLSRNGFVKGFKCVRGLPPFQIIKATELTCHDCKYYQSIKDTWQNKKITQIKDLRILENKLELFLCFTDGEKVRQRWIPAVIATKFCDKSLCQQFIENHPNDPHIQKFRRMVDASKPFPKSRTIRSYYPEVISQLSTMAQQYFNFTVIGRHLLSLSVGDLIGSLVPKGQVSFNGITTSIKETITLHLARAETNRLHTIKFAESQPTLHKFWNVGSSTDFSQLQEDCISFGRHFELPPNLAQKSILRLALKLENLIQLMFLNNSINSPSMCYDHVHLQRNRGRKNGATASFVAANYIGAPIFSCMQNSKSVKDLIQILKVIDEFSKSLGGQGFRLIFTDNLKQDKSTLLASFPNAATAEDLFHFFKGLYECVDKNSAYFALWIAGITFAAYLYDAADLNRLRAQGVPETDLNDPRFLQKNRDKIRPILASSETFVEKFQTLTFAFFELGCLNEGKIKKVLATLKQDAKNAFNLPADYPQFINIGTDEQPIYRALRGTGMCENINRQLQALQSQTWSPNVTHAVCILLLMRRSMDLNRVVLKKQYLENVYDLEVLNSLFLAQKSFKDDELGVSRLSPCNYFDGIDPSKHLSTFKTVVNSSQKEIPSDMHPDELHRKGNLEAKPFDIRNPLEARLLRAMCRTGNYFLNKNIKTREKYIDSEGALTDQFFKEVCEKGTKKVLHDKNLCLVWNKYVRECQTMQKTTVSILNLTFDVSLVSSKEPCHIAGFLDDYSQGYFRKQAMETFPSSLEQPAIIDHDAPPVLIPPSQNMETITSNSNPALAAKYPEVTPENVNQVPFNTVAKSNLPSPPTAPVSRKHVRSSSETRKKPKIAEVRNRSLCPECSVKKHSKASNCPFYLFSKENKPGYLKPKGLSKYQHALQAWNNQKSLSE